MSESLRNSFWRAAFRLEQTARRFGLVGRRLEQALERFAVFFIPAADKELVASLGYGLMLTLPPKYPQARTYVSGVYEESLTKLFKHILHEGMTVVDAGAFCGYYTLLGSRLVGILGHVYAFEADPGNFSYLLKNVRENECTNVTTIHSAVSDRTGFATLAHHNKPDRHWIALARSTSCLGVMIPTITLDEYFSGLGWPQVDLVKLDIEGSEQAALRGMKELCLRNPNLQIVMEFDEANLERSGASCQSISQAFCDLGFDRGYVIEEEMKPFSTKSGIPKTRINCNLLISKS